MEAIGICTLDEYTKTFVQRHPSFGIKTDSGWRTRNYPLHDEVIKDHLDKKIIVGSIAKWYPTFGIIDLDDVTTGKVNRIRERLGLNENNSMLCSSESKSSYHVLFRPEYNGKPPTLKMMHSSLRDFVKKHGIEFYPQKKRKIRLPFGKYQDCLDEQYRFLSNWQEKLYWFNKLDSFDLKTVSKQQLEFNFTTAKSTSLILPEHSQGCFQQGADLFRYGLQSPSTRNESQFKVIYYLWRNGVELNEAIRQTWHWIQRLHNGFSKDILNHPARVKYEVEYQATNVYSSYDLASVYPDDTHNSHNGYICKQDVETIINLTGGSLPRMRFLFNLVKYSYPRRFRSFLNIHSDKFIEWGNQRTYREYLNELDEKGILKRGPGYAVGRFAKSVKLNWNYQSGDNAVMHSGRSVDTLEAAVKVLYEPSDLRAIVRKAGGTKQMASYISKQIFSG